MSHLVISCIDGRIRGRLKELEERLGENNPLWLLVPGGGLIFSESKAEADAVTGWLETLISRQGVDRIILVSHQRCLAYGRKLGGFFFDERDTVTRDLAKAKNAIWDRFPGIGVDCFIVPWLDDNPDNGFGPAEEVIVPRTR